MTEKSCGWAWRHLNQNDGAGTYFAGREHSAEPIRRGRAERRGNTPRRRAVCPQRSDEGHAERSLWLYHRGQSPRRIAPTRMHRRVGEALTRQERPTPSLAFLPRIISKDIASYGPTFVVAPGPHGPNAPDSDRRTASPPSPPSRS